LNKQETACIVGIIVETYPNLSAKPDWNVKNMVEVWSMLLGDIDFEIAKVAVIKACRQSKFPPSVSEIVEAANAVDPRIEQLPSSADAWNEVFGKIQSVGQYRKPDWSHEVIARAVGAMGWPQLCEGENLEADRAHFLRIYESMRTGHSNRAESNKALELSGMMDIIKALAGKMDMNQLPEGRKE